MKALTFHGEQTIKHETLPDPGILDTTDAIVKVALCAICGSDMHPYHGREKGLDKGTVMGHEFVGEVVEVGTDIRRLKKGMHTFSPFTTNCGHCFYCLRGLTCRCVYGQLYGWVQAGIGLHGGQAEFVRVPLADSTLMELPPGVEAEEALLLGDIFSTGYFCADMAEIEPSGVYAVVGCGPVGLMSIIGARELGAERLYAIDSIAERLEMAERLGATPIDFTRERPTEILQDATGGRGADAVMEVVGSESAARSAFALIRPGGIISSVGVHTEPHIAFSPTEAYDKNVTYKTGRCPARHYMQKLVPLVQEKKYDLTSVITHKLPLKQGVDGYRIFDEEKDKCLKVTLEP